MENGNSIAEIQTKATDMLKGLQRRKNLNTDYIKLVENGLKKLNIVLKFLGAKSTKSDPCVYHLNKENGLTFIAIYVDDIPVV